MAIKFHRCKNLWVKTAGHPCWRVQKALDEEGIHYELAKHRSFGRFRRNELQQLSGQRLLRVIEFADGTVYREESKDMAETIRAGKLDEKRGTPAAAG